MILVLHTKNLKAGELFSRYHKGDWIKKRIQKWERGICALIKTVDKYTQESYATVACAVQSERIFLQLVTKGKRQAFTGMEKVLLETFLPHIFFG